jgi:hypothetical protein
MTRACAKLNAVEHGDLSGNATSSTVTKPFNPATAQSMSRRNHKQQKKHDHLD